MEQGEGSGSKASHEIWSKLVPSDSRYSDVELRSDEVEICSELKISSFEKRGWCKITRNSDLCSATLQNTSLNAILVDETAVETDDTIIINCGSEIIPGPASQGYLSYRFKVMPMNESSKKVLKISLDSDHAKCSICLNIWHDVVTVAPCLHSFCNGCFSEWLRRSQQKHSSVLCPHCRSVVQFVGRNHFLHSVEEEILQSDSSLRRSDEELAVLDSYALIKSPLVINNGKKARRKRSRMLPEEVSNTNGMDLACAQCGMEYGGFQCNQNTVHLQCQACGGMMPSRTNIRVPQHCIGCDRAFCGAYWHSQQVTTSDSYHMCAPETFKPIAEQSITRIPFLAHERNRHEQDITERCIRLMGKTLQDVVSEWITKLSNREIDHTRIPLNHGDMINAGTYISNALTSLSPSSCTGSGSACQNIFYLGMWCKGKIVGMDTLVEHSTIMKTMLVKGTTFVVRPGVQLEISCILQDFWQTFSFLPSFINFSSLLVIEEIDFGEDLSFSLFETQRPFEAFG